MRSMPSVQRICSTSCLVPGWTAETSFKQVDCLLFALNGWNVRYLRSQIYSSYGDVLEQFWVGQSLIDRP